MCDPRDTYNYNAESPLSTINPLIFHGDGLKSSHKVVFVSRKGTKMQDALENCIKML